MADFDIREEVDLLGSEILDDRSKGSTLYQKVKSFEQDNFSLTDLGNSKRIGHYYGDELRYNHTNDEWHHWVSGRWMAGDVMKEISLAKEVPNLIVAEGNGMSNGKADHYFKWAGKSCNQMRIKAALSLAQSDPRIAVTQDRFDADPNIINMQNGIYDLITMKLMPHDPMKYCSKIIPVSYDAHAECPKFDEFMLEITDGNEALINFLAKIFGYCLTGKTGERVFFIFYGDGMNGKSTLTNLMIKMMGDYAGTVPMNTFLASKHDPIRNDLAMLSGLRLVSASESEAKRRLNEPLVKALSGNDPITARFLHREFFTYTPQFKIIMHTNYKPIVSASDQALWDRLRPVPFNVRIPAERVIPDYHEVLFEERSGIFNWLLKGLMDYYETGLKVPDEVQRAANIYRAENDFIGEFLEEKTSEGGSIEGAVLYKEYKAMCDSLGEFHLSNQLFAQELRKRGYKDTRGKKGKIWHGISAKLDLDF